MLGNVGGVNTFYSGIESYLFTSKGKEKNTRKFKPRKKYFQLAGKVNSNISTPDNQLCNVYIVPI